MPSRMQKPYVDKQCEECGYGTYRLPISGQAWHVACNECNAVRFCYDPLPHQAKFHADSHPIKAFFGGYGSGKQRLRLRKLSIMF